MKTVLLTTMLAATALVALVPAPAQAVLLCVPPDPYDPAATCVGACVGSDAVPAAGCNADAFILCAAAWNNPLLLSAGGCQDPSLPREIVVCPDGCADKVGPMKFVMDCDAVDCDLDLL